MSTPTLPTLELQNPDYWHRSLQAFAFDADLNDFLNPANTAPEDPDQFATYRQKQERLTLTILSSLPRQIAVRLTKTNLQLPPSLLIQQILQTVQEITAIDHSLLESNARNTHLTSINNVEEYITTHNDIRIAMRNANYPRIDDESTSIQFMIQGIDMLPDLETTHEIMTQTPPQTIAEFCTRLRRATNNIKARATRYPQRQQPSHKFSHTQRQPANRRQTQPWRIPRPATSTNRRTNKWCHYHNSSTHNNQECKSQRRPQFKQTANHTVAATQHNIEHDNTPLVSTDAEPLNPHAYATTTTHDEGTYYVLDSGASPSHLNRPHSTTPATRQPRYTTTAANHRHPITHSGTIQIPTPTMNLNITDAVVTPDIKHNLISVHTLAQNHGPVTFTPSKAYIHPRHTPQSLPIASYRSGLYLVDNKPPAYHTHTEHCNNTQSTSPSTNATPHKPPLNTPAGNTRSRTKAIQWDRPWRRSASTTPSTQPKQPPTPTTTRPNPNTKRPTPTNTSQLRPAAPTKTHSSQKITKRTPTRSETSETAPNPTASTNPKTPLPQSFQRYNEQPPLPAVSKPLITTPTSRTPNPLTQPGPTDTPSAAHDLHLALGHPNPRTMRHMCRHKSLPALLQFENMPIPDMTCSSCAIAKIKASPHKPTQHQHHIGQHISSDICGPLPTPSRQGNRYFITFTDTKTRHITIHCIPNRSTATITRITMDHMEKIHTVQGKYPRFLRTDNAKEYLSETLRSQLQARGITHITTAPYTPQQNSIAERVNQTLMGIVRASLDHSRLTDAYWQDALTDAVFKRNLIPHASTQKIPHIEWYQTTPRIQRLFAFGQLGHAPTLAPTHKLNPKGTLTRYLHGIDQDTICVQDTQTNQVHKITAVDFHPYQTATDPTASTEMAFHVKSKPKPYPPTPSYITEHTPAPYNHRIATNYPDATHWETAHNNELSKIDNMRAIQWLRNNEVPHNARPLPLTMTYRYKRNPNGDIEERKARCAVRGDLMKPNIHYDPNEIATFTADKTTIRLILSHAAAHNLHTEHFDISSAYLHEPFHHNHPVYVKQYPLFDGTLKHPHKYGELKGNLYGTKQAGRIFCTGATQFLTSHGFTQLKSDPCLFMQTNGNDQTIIAVTIDDFLVCTTNQQLLTKLYTLLTSKYSVKRLGRPTKYLNWQISYNAKGTHISQPHIITSLIDKTNMQDAKPISYLYSDGIDLSPPSDNDTVDPTIATPYREALGELRYLTDSTRPDIQFFTNSLARANHKPTTRHWKLLKRLIRYLKHTPTHGISFSNNPSAEPLKSYCDADFANDTTTRKSISGSVLTLNDAPISWSSQRQSIVALSTCEAETIAASDATRQTNWIGDMLKELLIIKPKQAIRMFTDSQSALSVAANTAPTKRRKFIDIRYHHLMDNIQSGRIDLQYLPSDQNLADIFTKPLRPTPFTHLTTKLHITNPKNTTSLPAPRRQGECQDAKTKKSPSDTSLIPRKDAKPSTTAPEQITPLTRTNRPSSDHHITEYHYSI